MSLDPLTPGSRGSGETSWPSSSLLHAVPQQHLPRALLDDANGAVFLVEPQLLLMHGKWMFIRQKITGIHTYIYIGFDTFPDIII